MKTQYTRKKINKKGNSVSSGVTRRKFVQLAALVSPTLLLAACGEQSTASTPAQSTVTTVANTAAGTTSTTAAVSTANNATTAVSTTAVPGTTAAAISTQATNPASTTAAALAGQTARALAATPACTSKVSQTLAETEGPYFKPSSPERNSLLEAGINGTRLVLTGYVLTTDCQPVKGALLDFWQADANGQYDNQNFRLRGHQYTFDTGAFQLETVIPGLYPGRTRHIHVKVQAPNQPILTTQLFFPGEPRNQSDNIFHPQLLMQLQEASGGSKAGAFNFVLKTV